MDRKAQNKLDGELRKIEEAAMKSYAKDISDGTDLSARNIKRGSKAIDPMALPNYYDEEDGPSTSKKANHATVPIQSESLWCEAKSEEGHTYYWNIKTNGKEKLLIFKFIY